MLEMSGPESLVIRAEPQTNIPQRAEDLDLRKQIRQPDLQRKIGQRL